MSKYLIMPEGGTWTEAEAATAAAAYAAMCYWHSDNRRIAVMNTETGEAAIFTRTLDKAGNLQAIRQHYI